jgi:eukaryotic-like serine/threonine-protein kinase
MELNKRIGDYELLEELGRGGMGRVYKVRNVLSDRIEAMKVLLPDLVGRQDLASRFQREIKLLAALDHPNIAALRTALTVDNQLVMIMEFVEGQSLAERLKRGAIPIADAINYIEQGLVALSYAHAQHVVHRDIKPANMMLTADGVVKLMDFGIARQRDDQTLTVAGTTTGSLSYMSPEQVNGEKTDGRSDLYSMGISLYELVTGQRPFRADSDFAVMVAHLKEAPRPPIELKPELGPQLNEIILTSIAKDPAARFQSADAFRAALEALHGAAITRPLGSAAAVGAFPGNAARRRAAEQAPTMVDPPTAPVAAMPTRTVTGAATPVPPVSPLPTPQPVPGAAMPPPVARSGQPALYVVLGGVLVLAALVGAGLYIGRAEAQPGDKSTASAPPPAPTPTPAPPTPAPTPAAAAPAPSAAPAAAVSPAPALPPAAGAASATPPAGSAAPTSAATSPAAPPPAMAPAPTGAVAAAPGNTAKPAAASLAPRTVSSGPTGAPRRANERDTAVESDRPASSGAAAQPGGGVDFDELENDVDQLLTRASAVNHSLDNLRQEQSRMGLGLRGDIVSRQESMNLNLTRAREAVQQHNAARAQRFKSLAESDIEALEKFLGR